MKCLKINNGKGLYSLDGENWKTLDEIKKEDIILIIDKCISVGFDMCDPTEKQVDNKAHEIIYLKLHDKFNSLNSQRDRFKDESEELFKDAFLKYSEQ